MGTDIHGPLIAGRISMWPSGPASARELARLPYCGVGRDYNLFGLLGVERGETGTLFAGRGYPADDYWGGGDFSRPDWFNEHGDDCHDPSWLTTEQCAQVQTALVKYTGDYNPQWKAMLMLMQSLEADGWTDVRAIFCFDS